MEITSTQLRQLGACEDPVQEFESLFGQGVELTLDICLQNVSRFDFNWAAEKMLTPAALAEYQRARDTAYAEYRRVRAAAWTEYDRVLALADAEYKRAKATAFYNGLSD